MSSCASTRDPDTTGGRTAGTLAQKTKPCILSKAVGKPVRVQWTRADDFQWSTQSPIGLLRRRDWPSTRTARSRRTRPTTTCRRCRTIASSLRPHRDARHLGAGPARSERLRSAAPSNSQSRPWLYDRIENVHERGVRHVPVGQKASPIAVGLRDHSLRTPGQFPAESPSRARLQRGGGARSVSTASRSASATPRTRA